MTKQPKLNPKKAYNMAYGTLLSEIMHFTDRKSGNHNAFNFSDITSSIDNIFAEATHTQEPQTHKNQPCRQPST